MITIRILAAASLLPLLLATAYCEPFEQTGKATSSSMNSLWNLLSEDMRDSFGGEISMLSPDGHEFADALLINLRKHGLVTQKDRLRHPTASWISAAETVMRGEVSLLGSYGPQKLGIPFDWFAAPEGDLQWTTHLSRHYFLLPVAMAYAQTKEPRFAEFVLDTVADWNAKFPNAYVEGLQVKGAVVFEGERVAEGHFNDYPDGPWTSLSAHVRVETWLKLLQLLADYEGLTNERLAMLLQPIFTSHRACMLAHPRKHTANQFQGIAVTLIDMGLFFPDIPSAVSAGTVGWRRLCESTQTAIYPDGSLAECSPNYGFTVVARLGQVMERAQALGKHPPEALLKRFKAARHYLALSIDPAGYEPRIAKGGNNIIAGLRELNRLEPDPEISWITDGYRQDELSASGVMQPANVWAFDWAGHVIFRSDWSKDAVWLFFEPGPRGAGHHDLAALNFHLKVGSEAFFTDPGFYAYGTGTPEKQRIIDYLHSTAAHNTALVDGAGQNRFSAFGAQSLVNTSKGDYKIQYADGFWSAEGTYTHGYGSGGEGVDVIHTRKIYFSDNGRNIKIQDNFTGDGSHDIRLHWQVHPDIETTLSENGAILKGTQTSIQLDWGEQPISISRHEGETDPVLGWYSEKYGELVPSTTLIIGERFTLPATITTTITIDSEDSSLAD
ncbi:MAG: alginate lyase family protein [Puniceicoccales bacterium]